MSTTFTDEELEARLRRYRFQARTPEILQLIEVIEDVLERRAHARQMERERVEINRDYQASLARERARLRLVNGEPPRVVLVRSGNRVIRKLIHRSYTRPGSGYHGRGGYSAGSGNPLQIVGAMATGGIIPTPSRFAPFMG